jgi:hypothetical protein
MPRQDRCKTRYPGVYCIDGKIERIYYIFYRKNGKQVEEKVGPQFRDDMTPARAARIRAPRFKGGPTNQERSEAAGQAELPWTFDRPWQEYKARKPGLKGLVTDENRYQNHLKPLLGVKEIDPGGRQGHSLGLFPGLIQIPPRGDYYNQGPSCYQNPCVGLNPSSAFPGIAFASLHVISLLAGSMVRRTKISFGVVN